MKLLLVCTDRGQHSTAALGSIRRLPGGRMLYLDDENARRTADRGASPPTARSRADGGVTFLVRCPRCRRDRPIRHENAQKLMRDGLEKVDISHLP